MAAVADVATSYPPNDLVGLSNQPPSAEHYLGTDTIGRDIFTRLLFGARVSLLVGFSAVTVGMTRGLFLGLLTGYLKGTLDLLVQRLVDTLEAFPGIVLALAIVAILGASVWNVVLALAIGYLGPATRVTRSVVLRERERTYAEAARALGASTPRVMLVHVLPNSLSPYFVLVSIFVGLAIIAESSLSFLGAGVGPETASWGGNARGGGAAVLQRHLHPGARAGAGDNGGGDGFQPLQRRHSRRTGPEAAASLVRAPLPTIAGLWD